MDGLSQATILTTGTYTATAEVGEVAGDIIVGGDAHLTVSADIDNLLILGTSTSADGAVSVSASSLSSDIKIIEDTSLKATGSTTLAGNVTGAYDLEVLGGDVTLAGAANDIKTLTVDAGATVTVADGAELKLSHTSTINGSLVNNGTLTADSLDNFTSLGGSTGYEDYDGGTTNGFVAGEKVQVFELAAEDSLSGTSKLVVAGTEYTLVNGVASGTNYSVYHVNEDGATINLDSLADYLDANKVTTAPTIEQGTNSATYTTSTTGALAYAINGTGNVTLDIDGATTVVSMGSVESSNITKTGNGTLTADNELAGKTLTVEGGTLQINTGGGNPGYQTATVKAGATLHLTQVDAMGYNSATAGTITLDGTNADGVATLKVNKRLTMKSSVALNGDAQIIKGIETTDGDRAMFDTFGGSISASGTNNTIGIDISNRQALTVNVAEDGDLTVSGKFTNKDNSSNAKVTKAGAGNMVLTSANDSRSALQINGGSVTLTETGSWAGTVNVSSNGKLVLDGGTKTLSGTSNNVVMQDGASTLEIAGGNITLQKNFTNGSAQLNVTGGTAEIAENGGWAGDVTVGNGATIAYNGGEKSLDKVDLQSGSTLEVKSGTVTLNKAVSVDRTNNGGNANGNIHLGSEGTDGTIKLGDSGSLAYDNLTITGVADKDSTISAQGGTELSLWQKDMAAENVKITDATAGRLIGAAMTDVDYTNTAGGATLQESAKTINNLSVKGDLNVKTDTTLTDASVGGNMTVDSGNALTLTKLGGLDVTGTLTLNSGLELLTKIDVTDVTESTSYTIATAGSLVGLDHISLDKVMTGTLADNVTAELVFDSGALALQLTATQVVEPADVAFSSASWVNDALQIAVTGDVSGLTELALLVTDAQWQEMVAAVEGAGQSPANPVAITLLDEAGNLVDASSLALSLNGYVGEGEGMYTLTYVPEPATGMLSVLALAALAMRRRRKH